MWIFLNNSYLSVVKHRTLPNVLLVRARNRGDIEAVFPMASVEVTPIADYLFRALVHKSLVGAAIKRSILDIDYDNFKNSILDRRYHDACMGVWSTMNAYQQVGAYYDEEEIN